MRRLRLSTPRRLSLTLALVAGVLFVVGASVWIPWSALPPGSVDPHSVFSSAELHMLRSYASEQRHLSWGVSFVTLGMAILLAMAPVLRRAFLRLPGRPWLQALWGTIIIALASQALTLPLAWMLFQNERRAGVSVESTGLWWRDWGVGLVVGWVPFALGVVTCVWVVGRFPRAWSAILAGIAGVAVIVGSLIVPVVVEPLFTQTHPLPPGALRTAVFRLAAREGVHLNDVVVADASTRTTAENAEVAGFGPSERMVLDDTLLRSMSEPELEVVVAHELGHAAHHDVLTGTLLGAVGAIALIGLLGLLFGGEGDDRLARATAAPLLFAMVTVGGFAISPVNNAMSRAIESRADRAALSATHDPATFVRVQVQLDMAARLDPTPPAWSQFWWGSHPTVLERISLAR